MVAAVEGFLHPVDAESLELAGDGQGVLEGPGGFGVPGHAPALVAVDHQFEAVSHAGADCLQRFDVIAPVAAVEAYFQGGKSLREVALGGFSQGAWVA